MHVVTNAFLLLLLLMQECHRELMTHNTITCPLCLKCILSREDQQRYWTFMDEQVC